MTVGADVECDSDVLVAVVGAAERQSSGGVVDIVRLRRNSGGDDEGVPRDAGSKRTPGEVGDVTDARVGEVSDGTDARVGEVGDVTDARVGEVGDVIEAGVAGDLGGVTGAFVDSVSGVAT